MQTRMSNTAGMAAHAAGSRLHAESAYRAGWPIADTTTRTGAFVHNTVVIADPSKLRFRWPQESSP
jgi:hypothetical protein